MIGLGTIVNVGTVLIGTTIGILLKNGLPKRFEKTVMQGLGLTTCFIGIGGTLSEVLIIQDGEIGTQHTMLLILCLALGAVIGEALNIEQRLEVHSVNHTLPPKGTADLLKASLPHLFCFVSVQWQLSVH